MGFCFRAFKFGRKNSGTPNLPSPPSQSSVCLPSSSSSQFRRRGSLPPEMEIMEKKRWDSLESWSMLLEPGNAESLDDGQDGEREEWMADLSQLFIGNKFASGSHSRIYRGIYKQRAVAIKMVRIPDQDEEKRAKLEEQFKSEVSFLSRLYHPNVVQVLALVLLFHSYIIFFRIFFCSICF